jgi:hypothetical protein
MKYVCLGYYEKDKREGMTEGEQHPMFDTCFEYDDHLRAIGQWAGGLAERWRSASACGSRLAPYWKNGKVATTDGPVVLEARDLNHVVQLMAQHPALEYGSIFEIRPAADMSATGSYPETGFETITPTERPY